MVKSRDLRQDQTLLALSALFLIIVLIAINALWPATFGLVVAIGGAIGAMVVIYEVRLTQRIAQAEFVRDLQSGFASDRNICKLWKKLLLEEEITPKDRPLVSSFLTFFETLHLLLAKGALELSLTDELFRNRFFTAIGDKGIQEMALIGKAGSFGNVHDLIETWHEYLLDQHIPVHQGYYSYIQALVEAKGFELVRIEEQDLPDLIDLQEQVLDSLEEKSQLRANTEVMLKECVTEHFTLGLRRAGDLVAAAALFDGGTTDESIRRYFTEDQGELELSVNLKLVLTLPGHRRAGLGRTLVELLEQHASEAGKTNITCTIHPKNASSKSLFGRLGYEPEGAIKTKYGRREVFAKTLPTPDSRWTR